MKKMRVTAEFVALVDEDIAPDEIDHEVRKCLHAGVALLRDRGIVRVRKVVREDVYSGHVN